MGLRAGLRYPLGILLLLLSCLLAAALAWLPLLAERSDRAPWVLIPGVLAYLITALIVGWPAAESRHPAVQRMVDLYRSMEARLKELQTADSGNRSALIPVVTDALDHMSRELLPALRQIVARHADLSRHLADYDAGKLPLPDPQFRERLQRVHESQQEAIDGCVRQAANAYATMLVLMQEADEAAVVEDAKMWAIDLLDIYDSLSGLLSGLDPYEQEMMRLRPEPALAGRAPTAIEGEVAPVEPAAVAGPVEPPARAAGRAARPAHPDGLTEREVEVLMLLAEGYTSGEIAQELVVTVATVSRHIANIYNKINARGRAEATRYAIRHGLLRQEGETSGGADAAEQPAAGRRAEELRGKVTRLYRFTSPPGSAERKGRQ